MTQPALAVCLIFDIRLLMVQPIPYAKKFAVGFIHPMFSQVIKGIH